MHVYWPLSSPNTNSDFKNIATERFGRGSLRMSELLQIRTAGGIVLQRCPRIQNRRNIRVETSISLRYGSHTQKKAQKIRTSALPTPAISLESPSASTFTGIIVLRLSVPTRLLWQPWSAVWVDVFPGASHHVHEDGNQPTTSLRHDLCTPRRSRLDFK